MTPDELLEQVLADYRRIKILREMLERIETVYGKTAPLGLREEARAALSDTEGGAG